MVLCLQTITDFLKMMPIPSAWLDYWQMLAKLAATCGMQPRA